MVLRPVGPQPAAVYWRRRVLLLLAVLVVVVVLVRACGGGASPTADQHRDGSGAPSRTTQAAGPCAPGDLSAAVTARPARAPAGTPIRFVGVVSNTSAVTCLLQVTPDEVVWTVRSGATKEWKCVTSYTTQQSLPPSGSLRLHITWQGKVSAPPKCQGTATAPAGAYGVRLRVGKTGSPLGSFRLVPGKGNSQG